MKANTEACLLDRGRPEGLMLPAGQLVLAYPSPLEGVETKLYRGVIKSRSISSKGQ